MANAGAPAPQISELTILPDACQAAVLLQALFHSSPTLTKTNKTNNYGRAFLAYYTRQCIESLNKLGTLCSARTHQDIQDVVNHIRHLQQFDLVIEALRHDRQYRHLTQVSDHVLARTAELGARLLTMHEIGAWTGSVSGQNRLVWNSGMLKTSLEQFHSSPTLENDSIRFESHFDIVALEQIAGFTIVWTDNLADHLAISDKTRSVRIFHQATFLQAAMHNTDLFPEGFIEETLCTLRILFPHRDAATNKWFLKKTTRDDFRLDKAVLTCGRLSQVDRKIERYRYWHDRLVMLKQEFDDAEPLTPHQWWRDRRNRVQWSTFWVAVLVLLLTIFFGVVQSIEGALQVYKAYNPS